MENKTAKSKMASSNSFPIGPLLLGIIIATSYYYFTFDDNSTPAMRVKTVEIADGRIRGLRETSLRKHVDFYAFRGIPFAKPPLGELRFKAPEPAESWKPAVLDAFKYSNMCIQPIDPANKPHPQHEDCLYLNVYIPVDIGPNEKLAVMVYIFGGAHFEGNAHDIPGPDFLLENRVILVAMNHRLGALGFLSLGLPEYSGNMGLKDQQLALKWVHRNIEQFGGDNKRITVFGHSSGGICTHFQILSEESRKYFNQAILMSGNALLNSAVSSMENHVEMAYDMAKKWKQPQHNLHDLVELLKNVPAENFVEFTAVDLNNAATFKFPFAPIIEKSNAVKPFMVQRPEDIYKNVSMDVDILFGTTSQEFLTMSNYKISPTLKKGFNITLPFNALKISSDSKQYQQLVSDVREFYFGNAEIDEKLIEQYVTLFSDINFAYHAYKAAKLHAQQTNSKTYLYHFAVESKLNAWKRKYGFADKPGASHCDDLCYVFRCDFAEKLYNEVFGDVNDEHSKISLEIIDKMTKMFTNFVKYGKPIYDDNVPALLPYRSNQFLNITNHALHIGTNLRKDAIEFWEDIERRAYAEFENESSNV